MTRAEILNRLRVMVVSLAVQLVVGIADYVTGNELHVDVFYFIPISITAWYLRRGDVVVSALIGAFTWGYADIRSGHHYTNQNIWYWNIFVCFCSLLVLGLAVKAQRDNLTKKEQARLELLKALNDLHTSTAEMKKLRGQLQEICEWSKRIKVEGQWITFEEFLKKHLGVEVLHGKSPEALEHSNSELAAKHPTPAPGKPETK